MAFSINNKMAPQAAQVYYTAAYQLMIESHLSWIKNQPTTYWIPVSPDDANKYDGDLTGLLTVYSVPPEHHFTVMRMNDMTAMTDYSSKRSTLMVPHYQVLESLRQVFVSTHTSLQ